MKCWVKQLLTTKGTKNLPPLFIQYGQLILMSTYSVPGPVLSLVYELSSFILKQIL